MRGSLSALPSPRRPLARAPLPTDIPGLPGPPGPAKRCSGPLQALPGRGWRGAHHPLPALRRQPHQHARCRPQQPELHQLCPVPLPDHSKGAPSRHDARQLDTLLRLSKEGFLKTALCPGHVRSSPLPQVTQVGEKSYEVTPGVSAGGPCQVPDSPPGNQRDSGSIVVTGRQHVFLVHDTSRPLLSPHTSHGGVYEAPHWTAEEAQVQGKEMLRTRATNAGTSPRADAETQALSLIPVTRRTRLTTKLRRVSLKEGDGESVAGVREPSNIWKADLGKVKGFYSRALELIRDPSG